MRGIAFIAAAALLVCGALPHAQQRSRLVLLGTGTPNADPDRYGPSVAVVVDETSYLVDFGVGVVRRAAAAERAGIKALAAPNLTLAFATHLHSDHTLGLADLILTPWILDRVTPLTLYGPRGLRAMGAQVSETEDGLEIIGGAPLHGTRLSSFGDHRIAMAFAIAGLFAEGETIIEDTDCVATSYPGFDRQLEHILKQPNTRETPVISSLPPAT